MTDDDVVAEAMRRATVVWLAGPDRAAAPAWCLWRDGSAYVVGGPGEQPLPGIPDSGEIAVTIRSPLTHARVLTWVAAVNRLTPGDPRWRDIVPALLAARLSAATDAEKRWAGQGRVLRLTPTGAVPESGPTLPSDGGYAVPVPTPATTA